MAVCVAVEVSECEAEESTNTGCEGRGGVGEGGEQGWVGGGGEEGKSKEEENRGGRVRSCVCNVCVCH